MVRLGSAVLHTAGRPDRRRVDGGRNRGRTQSETSTGGGTSDGRFIAPTGAQVVELGVVNATIHKVNECCRVRDIDTLEQIYIRLLEGLLGN